jgi:hypothetical protein
MFSGLGCRGLTRINLLLRTFCLCGKEQHDVDHICNRKTKTFIRSNLIFINNEKRNYNNKNEV